MAEDEKPQPIMVERYRVGTFTKPLYKTKEKAIKHANELFKKHGFVFAVELVMVPADSVVPKKKKE